MKNTLKVMSLLLLISLLTVWGTACCGPWAAGEIRIGIMGGQTGPAASSVVPLFEELEHVLNYVNQVEGGIQGMKLDWQIVDNEGTPEGAIAAYNELKDSFDPLFYIVVEDYYYFGIKDTIEEDGAVLLTTSALLSNCYVPPGRFFATPIPTADGFAGFVKWVLEDWEGSGQPKIGVLYWNLPSGLQWAVAQSWATSQGVQLVPVEFPITTTDLTAQRLQLTDAGVDYIWMMGLTSNAQVAVRDFQDLADQIPFCFNEFVESEVLLGLVGEDAEGFYIYRSETPYSDGSQAAQLYTDIWEWAEDTEKWSDNRLSITIKAVIEAMIGQAITNVGKNNLDSAAIYEALTQLTEIDTWGNSPGFGFGADKRVGVSSIKMAQFTQTGTVAVSELIDLPRTFEGIDT